MVGALESLVTEEPLKERIERNRFDRLIMLSDGVFAIAITLLTLELRPPEHWSGGWSELLTDRWRPILGFVLSFVIVGAFWLAHREIFARLRRIDVPATFLALIILLLVTLAPAVASLLAEYGPNKAMPAYLGLIFAISTAQGLLWAWATYGGYLIDESITRHGRLILLIRFSIPALIGLEAMASWGRGSPALSAITFLIVIPAVIGLRLIARRH